ncbi:hypothetical protein DLM76_20620 [Leptospira yasudae]|nr:hypothetical protein DLM76_20620 [Leptospira yasudae]
MQRESRFSEYRVVRELTYAWLYYFLSLQSALLGNNRDQKQFEIRKSVWSDAMDSLRKKFYGELLIRPTFFPKTIQVTPDPSKDYSPLRRQTKIEFPEGVVYREDLNEKDQEIFDFLARDWNEVYLKERDKATILGYVAEYMIGEGEDPDELKRLSLPEFSEKAIAHNLPGLEDIDVLREEVGLTKEQTYALLYTESKGAEWLAIYDNRGERKGKAFELITNMYRRQIVEALARNATEEEIESLMISPDDTEIKDALGMFEEGISEEERSLREKEYEELVTDHLNRDMARFAFTECAINFNNGKLLMLANESETATYVRMSGGNYGNPHSHTNPVRCNECKRFRNEIARVFPSKESLKDKRYMKSLGLVYLGQDQFYGDPKTTIAVWPGKSNAERKYGEYWFCCPMHPNCSCEYEVVEEEKEEREENEIDEIFREGRIRDAKERLRTDARYEEEVKANEERIRLERIFGPIRKSDVYRSGIWEEPMCSHEEESEWLSEFITWKQNQNF